MHVFVSKGKPVMYQRQNDGMYVIRGRDVECEGVTAQGAYTRWRNMVAYREMGAEVRAQFHARINRPRPPLPGLFGLPVAARG